MAYVTYFTARPPDLPAASRQRRVARVYGTQAEANARAAGAADETVYGRAVSDDVDLGWWVTITGVGAGTVSQTPEALPADTARKRAAARKVHAALMGWTAALAAEGIAHAASVVGVGHDFLYRAHQATYLVFVHGGYTVAQLESWATEMAKGAADVTSPQSFFRRMEASALASPNQPAAWVRFTAGVATRVNLADALAASGPRNGGLNLQANQLPADGLSADGSWIDSLT